MPKRLAHTDADIGPGFHCRGDFAVLSRAALHRCSGRVFRRRSDLPIRRIRVLEAERFQRRAGSEVLSLPASVYGLSLQRETSRRRKSRRVGGTGKTDAEFPSHTCVRRRASRAAWSRPTSESGTSRCPWIRPSALEDVSPCRTRRRISSSSIPEFTGTDV